MKASPSTAPPSPQTPQRAPQQQDDDGAARDVVRAAVLSSPNGRALQYASAALRDDESVVGPAVAKHGPQLLRFASTRLRAKLSSSPSRTSTIVSVEQNSESEETHIDGDMINPPVAGEAHFIDLVKRDRNPLGLKFSLRGAEVLAKKKMPDQAVNTLLAAVRVGDRLILINGRYLGPDVSSDDLRKACCVAWLADVGLLAVILLVLGATAHSIGRPLAEHRVPLADRSTNSTMSTQDRIDRVAGAEVWQVSPLRMAFYCSITLSVAAVMVVGKNRMDAKLLNSRRRHGVLGFLAVTWILAVILPFALEADTTRLDTKTVKNMTDRGTCFRPHSLANVGGQEVNLTHMCPRFVIGPAKDDGIDGRRMYNTIDALPFGASPPAGYDYGSFMGSVVESRSVKVLRRYYNRYKANFAPGQPLFLAKVIVIEVLEVVYQVIMFFLDMKTQEVSVVLLSGLLLSTTLIVEPIIAVWGILTPEDSPNRPKLALTALAFELLCDQGFVVIGVFVRAPTVEALCLGGSCEHCNIGKVVYHGSIIVACVFALITLDDIRLLAKSSATRHEERRRSLSAASAASSERGGAPPRSEGQKHRVAGSETTGSSRSKKKAAAFIVGAIFCTAGVAIIAYVINHLTYCSGVWRDTFGDANACATPVKYFADDECGMRHVSSLDCSQEARGEQNYDNGPDEIVVDLPDSEPERFAKMDALKCIDFRNRKDFRRFPAVSWRKIKNLKHLQLAGSSLENLDSRFCVLDAGGNGRIRDDHDFPPGMVINVSSTPAAGKLDWSHTSPPLQIINFTTVAEACLAAVNRSLLYLNVASNAINTEDGLASLEIFTALLSPSVD
eukprot:g3068.t1